MTADKPQTSSVRESDIREIAEREVEALRQKNLLWRIRVLEGPSVPRAVIDGREVLIICSNNYLGLSNHPKLKRAAIEATERYGAGSGSVRVIAGTMDLHVKLEEKLAEYKGTESSIVFQTGFVANSGSIPQLAGEGDLIVSDQLNHGSIIDGCRLSRADRRIYPHKDMEALKQILEEAGKYRRVLILTDGVFSMDGDLAPLPEIVKLAKKYGALTYVDDAHGDGVLGRNGRGIADHFGLHGQVDIEMGTFSKAFGVVGGYIAGTRELCEFLLNRARPYLLTGSHPPAVAAACIAALEVMDDEPEIFNRLWENARYFKRKLMDLGFNTGQSETPITPVIVGESVKANLLADKLFEKGVFVTPIVYPMVAEDQARVRTIVTAAHTKEDLDFAVEQFEEAGKEIGVL